MGFHYISREGIVEISFDDGKANAIDRDFLEGLAGALDRAEADRAQAVVLSGRDGFFCAGLNLKKLPLLPSTELQATLELLTDVMLRIFLFPRPVVAAVTGHAIAGGAVLMLGADIRFAAQGSFKLGLNEVAIGITLPSFVIDMGIATLLPHRQMETLLHGKLYSPEEALAVGLVDQVLAASDVKKVACEHARELGSIPAQSYAVSKQRLRGKLIAASRADAHAQMASFVASIVEASFT